MQFSYAIDDLYIYYYEAVDMQITVSSKVYLMTPIFHWSYFYHGNWSYSCQGKSVIGMG